VEGAWRAGAPVRARGAAPERPRQTLSNTPAGFGLAPQEKQSALDELERQADLIEAELAERERKLQARPALARSTPRV
jgi:hypothetical protein